MFVDRFPHILALRIVCEPSTGKTSIHEVVSFERHFFDSSFRRYTHNPKVPLSDLHMRETDSEMRFEHSTFN